MNIKKSAFIVMLFGVYVSGVRASEHVEIGWSNHPQKIGFWIASVRVNDKGVNRIVCLHTFLRHKTEEQKKELFQSESIKRERWPIYAHDRMKEFFFNEDHATCVYCSMDQRK